MGWVLHEAGPENADHRVLLLPGRWPRGPSRQRPRFLRAQTRLYLAYLDRHGSLAKRFCDAGTRAWVVYGENDDVGITPDEREVLAGASHVTLIEIADTGHFALNQKPDEIAAIVFQAVSSATG